MPTAAPRACSTPGCAHLVTRDHPCPAHAPKPWSTGRAGRGSTRQWRVKRMWVGKERGLLCAVCQAEGRTVVWTELDHIVPVSHGGTDEYANLQGLCAEHHAAKTARERGR